MTVFVEARETNGKKGKWTFHSMYVDNMEGGKKREREYAKLFTGREGKKAGKRDRKEYKVEVTK
tara:strand:+ start:310 stop:501 length:192 start_codon:yes stop_codon:yes gene_type:complete